MQHRWPEKRRSILLAAVGLALAAAISFALRTSRLQQPVRLVQAEVAAIRGLEFKRPVAARRLSREESREYIARELAKMPKIEDYWAVVRLLGVYRGPDLGPPEKLYEHLLGFAAGAYDAYSDTFFQFEDLDEHDQKQLFGHELYHGLQDQHFDLKRYLLDMARRPDANQDAVLARQAVVEGEAIYFDVIYLYQRLTDAAPTREQLAAAVSAQGEWDPVQWEKSLRDPATSKYMRAQLLQAIEARKRLPPFMFELFFGSYIDGMAFIHAVHEKGWSEVEKLYREYPPESTEQILHPEKWIARESPVRIAWPVFDSDPHLADWKLLAENSLGERQWRIVFNEQGLPSEAESAAAGWNGDRYAVFKHTHDNTFLMLMYTSWDTSADAQEFAAAYRRVLDAKYRDAPVPARLLTEGNNVLIVEGGAEASGGDFMEINRRAVLGGK